MARRPTPERIDEARRAATRNRLIGDGLAPARADEWIARWEAQAASDALNHDVAFWDGCYRWVTSQRR